MTQSIRFAVAGARGRMGQAVLKVLTERGFEVATTFDKGDVIDLSGADAVIDFTTPYASIDIAHACADEGETRGKPLAHIIGSTGWMPAEEQSLKTLTDRVTIVRAGNFSLGVNMLMGLVKQAAAKLPAEDWDIEVLEAHHKRKVDAPSGTALMLGQAAAIGREIDLGEAKVAARDGLTGQRVDGTIGFSVIRGGGIIGEHSVLFASEDEIITLSHSARDRTLFARGAIEAALWAADKPAGAYDMQDVLGFND
ncbi:4-hydroxy-tetrahydrodipicolinate reductase [Asticcacaulis sp. ZE23SCel15]|uniref:4-hydroxy-tetrahydrodipicolinate reductase n=1 Tax=Asticcacaulis sp. ZE23SCel15 TaxID=3059027 RepID=UPI00265F58C9|nr:4-hydroxy-tetrahydrodipicolinate reductase [Asticcacaulis sp. ZE23SCel15]WKL58484.1 4-hydroxy-tetrahydrodipicolinate reductase [Asticcacaulis sp. ZE23SCel15]